MDKKKKAIIEQVVIFLIIMTFSIGWGWKTLTGSGGFDCTTLTTAFQDLTTEANVHNYEGPIQLLNTCDQDIVLRDDDNSAEMIIPTDAKMIAWPITLSDGTLGVNISAKHNGTVPTSGIIQVNQLR